jgi:hypothetical protein
MRHFFVRIIGALEFNYSNLPAANLKKAAAVDGIEKNLKKKPRLLHRRRSRDQGNKTTKMKHQKKLQ